MLEKDRKRRAAQIPSGSWPPRMMAEMAAGYVGEKHVEDFLEQIGTIYPQPRLVEGPRRKFWYREDLDKAMNMALASSPRFSEKLQAKMAERRAARRARVKA